MIRKVFSNIRHATSHMTFLLLVYHLTGFLLKMTVTILETLLPLILGPVIDEIRAGPWLPLPTFSPLGCVSFGWLYPSAFAPATERGAAK
jgi:hypothetical protein